MSKELETLEKLISFAFVMSENMVGLTKGNYDENQFIKKTYEYLHKYNVDLDSKLELKKALHRLEAIDNANPSEALEYLRSIEADLIGLPKHATEYDDIFDDYLDDIEDNIDKIEQVLLKTQEPKHYLKWEDLEFTRDEKVMLVKMGNTVYKILYRCCDGIEEVQLLSEDERLLILNLIGKYKDNIQVFNDLRLERVKE